MPLKTHLGRCVRCPITAKLTWDLTSGVEGTADCVMLFRLLVIGQFVGLFNIVFLGLNIKLTL